MTNGDPEGWIFLSYPHTNNGFFFLLTTVFIYLFFYLFNFYLFIYFKISLRKSLNTLLEMQFHMMTLLDVLGKIEWVR